MNTALFLKSQLAMEHSYRCMTFQYDKKVKYGSLKMTPNKYSDNEQKSNICRFLQQYRPWKSHQAGERDDSYIWQVHHCLRGIFQDVNIRRLMFHPDNASSHSERLTVEFLTEKYIKRMLIWSCYVEILSK